MTLKIGPFYLGKPSDAEIKAVARDCPKLPFNFPHVTATRAGPPVKPELAKEGWSVDHNRVQVGKGRAAYRQAQELLKCWKHFQLGWAGVNGPPVKEGEGVVVTAQSLFLWSCNPLRITYVEEGPGRLRLPGGREAKGHRLMFAHTTLGGHQISGEERFAVEWHPQDDSVWYDIYTISKPATPLAVLASPLLRFYQRRFVRESMASMQRQLAPLEQQRAAAVVAGGG